jgi:hypothetical protein
VSNDLLSSALAALARDARLWSDFLALCDCGGRQAGSPGEQRAREFALARLAAMDNSARLEQVSYAGWRYSEAVLTRLDPADDKPLACNPLLGAQSTPNGGVTAEVIDLGRGTLEQFEQHARDIAGRFMLVRHEYPFAADHVHRRRKYNWAMERGAAGYIIANPFPAAGPVAGSSGRDGKAGIPAVGTDYESAAQLSARGIERPRVHLRLHGEDYPAETSVVLLDIAGLTPASVVLSAHLDGHSLAESAMDNATGVAVVLAVARAIAPLVAQCCRGLKVCLFSAEEWALAGSRQYLDRMSAAERDALTLNINLDTVGGDTHLTALTSEFPRLDSFVLQAAKQSGIALKTHQPMMQNSDHYNFARHGIPALRLVAGFNRPQCNIRHILTGADTRDKVAPTELATAARLTATLLWQALNAEEAEIAALRHK